MHPSRWILALANDRPRIASALVSVLSLFWRPTNPHWLILELRRVARSSETIVVPVDSLRLEVPINSWTAEQFRTEGAYEPLTTDVIRHFARPAGTAVDVGANVGYFTLLMASRIGPDGHVYAFEPSPAMFRRLTANIRMNNLSCVQAADVALSDVNGRAALYRSTTEVMASLRQIEHSIDNNDDVATMTLDSFADRERLCCSDLIKIDVEGAELLVLRGAERLLRMARPTLVVEASRHSAAFNYAPGDLQAFLQSLGYELYSLDSLPLRRWDGTLRHQKYMNVLAVHSTRVSELPPDRFMRPAATTTTESSDQMSNLRRP